MLKPYQLAIRAKRTARACEARAETLGTIDAAWTLGNVRTYQRLMCDALKVRSEIIKFYLAQRAARESRYVR
jgi:hypothetical protein